MSPSWLFDAHPVTEGMELWLLDARGRMRREVVPFRPSMYLREPREMPELWRSLRGFPLEVAVEEKLEFESGRPLRVKRLTVPSPLLLPRLARALARFQDEVELFDADLVPEAQFFFETGLFPLARVEGLRPLDRPEDLDFETPPLRIAAMRMEGPALHPAHRREARLEFAWDGATHVLEADRPRAFLEALRDLLLRADPDVLLTDWGDAWLLGRLEAMAARYGVPLPFHRDGGTLRGGRAISYHSYGRIVYRAGRRPLRGRWHVDLRNSFIVHEAGLDGLFELARLSRIPVQQLARTTTGTAITAMELAEAYRRGILIPWHKSRPEDFKTADELGGTDKGGLVYVPAPGLYDRVAEIDFVSMFPSIMVRHNVSPETVNCPCCREAGAPENGPGGSEGMAPGRVPEIGHWTCRRRRGLVPAVLAPLIARRNECKRRAQVAPTEPERARWKARATALKWVLVTCLEGSTRLFVRRDGKTGIETLREAVRKGPSGLEVAGMDARGRPEWKKVAGVVQTRCRGPVYGVRFSGGRRAVATGDHLWPVLTPEGWTTLRTDALATGMRVPILQRLPEPESVESPLNLVEALFRRLPEKEKWAWRVRGDSLSSAVAANRSSPLQRGPGPDPRRRETQRCAPGPFPVPCGVRRHGGRKVEPASWLWEEQGILPLPFWPLVRDRRDVAGWRLGRRTRQGGPVDEIPARLPVDRDLGFFLGFFLAEGSFGRTCLRMEVREDERDLIPAFRRIVRRLWNLPLHVGREGRAGRRALQVNSVTLRRVLEAALDIGPALDRGKGAPRRSEGARSGTVDFRATPELRIPPIIWNGPREAAEGFLAGLFAGCGAVSTRRRSLRIAVPSESFARELSLLMVRLGLPFRMGPSRRPHAVEVRDDRGVRAMETFGPMAAGHRKRILALRSSPRRRPLRRPAGSAIPCVRVCAVERLPRAPRSVYCLRLADSPPWFAIQGGVLTHNCFGYLGYRNARFGRIEAHECVTAWSREKLLQAKEAAEARGFEIVHAIVDAIYVRKPGAERGDFEALARDVSQATGVEAALEEVYDWIAFYPARSHAGWGVPNRFVARGPGGLKVRGIEMRRGDMPPIVAEMQREMLERLSRARSPEEYRAAAPDLRRIFEAHAARLRAGRVTLEQLSIPRRLSRRPEEYMARTPAAAAARRLAGWGVELHPGEKIQIVLTRDGEPGQAEPFVPDAPPPDVAVEKYVALLRRALETLLSALSPATPSIPCDDREG